MKKIALIIFLVTIVGVLSGCQKAAKPVAKTKHGTLTLDQIGEIQPGLGQVMMEIGERFSVAGYAGKAKDWALSRYELEEIEEAAEVAMTTRPEFKGALESFIKGAFAKVRRAADRKDADAFETSFNNAVKACNGCHAAQDMAFIKYELPKTKPETPAITSK